jgi:drug/metabolite transporter (DMT)-like permease
LLAALLLNERLKDTQLLGGLIVLLGLAISFMEFKKKGKTHRSA